MPIYFFDIAIGTTRINDPDGTDLPSAEFAREHALETIRELMGTRVLRMLTPADCIVEVTNSEHRLLFKVPFTDTIAP